MSCECFHCVAYRVVHNESQSRDFILSVAGTTCPLCGVRTEEFYLVADTVDIQHVESGTGTWNLATGPDGGYAGFGGKQENASRGTSSAAQRLRRQLAEQADQEKQRMCRLITDSAQAGVAFTVGDKAEQDGRLDQARRAFEVCAGTGGRESFQAALRLGQLWESEQDHRSAARWYRQAADAPDAELRAAANLLLGSARQKIGEVDAAERAYQRAVDCGTGSLQALAALRVGMSRHDRGDRTGARDAYERVIALEDEVASPDAALNLGALEEEAGNWERARELWDYAHSCGALETSRLAAFNLGRYWAHRGKRRRARKFYRIAEHSENPEIAVRAARESR
ncbi:hypothetical protein LX90_007704 [Lentzea flava]|nr:hypothetical protein [Lentzea flava]